MIYQALRNIACLALFTGALVGGSPAYAQRSLPHVNGAATRIAPSTGPIVLRAPRFIAEAIAIHAIDESGYDAAGSDEIYAVFIDGGPGDAVTSVLGDFDTGEAKQVAAADRCITPMGLCATQAVSGPLAFQAALFERDQCGFVYGNLPGAHYNWEHGLCAGDDLVGRRSVSFTQAELLAVMPRVGDYVDFTLHFGGPCGYVPEGALCAAGWPAPTGPHYTLVYRITRLQDRVSTPTDMAVQ